MPVSKKTGKRRGAAGRKTQSKSTGQPARKRKNRPKGRQLHFREQPVSLFKRWLKWFNRLVLAAIVLSILLVLPLRWLNPATSSYMLQARWLDEVGVTWQWRDAGAIDWTVKLAVIAAEDQNFPQHYGFDVEAIRQAISESRDGGGLRGASTITQQVARNLYLWPGESRISKWSRKGLEAWLTLWLEMLLPKQRILEIHLNIAELGPGLYGVEAASRHYFSSTAAQLSQPQAAALASLLPSPKTYSLYQPGPQLRERREWIQRQMRQLGGEAFLQQHEL